MDTTLAIKKLLLIIHDLKSVYPHKSFTLDGRLVGDLGEIIVENNYDIKLYDKVMPKYDAFDSKNRKIQIKATFKKALGFPCEKKNVPDFYIGIKINEDGTFEEIYNGPGKQIWNSLTNYAKPKNNLYVVPISKLLKLNESIDYKNRIRKKLKS